MACDFPQQVYNQNQNLVVSINHVGSTATLFLQNTGHNILQLTRILIGASSGSGGFVLFLRPPGQPITWQFPSATLEQGNGATFFTLNNLPAGAVVSAQAEYIEVQDRARSCLF